MKLLLNAINIFMCAYTYIFIQIHIHINIYIYVNIYIYTYMYSYVCVCVFVCVSLSLFLRAVGPSNPPDELAQNVSKKSLSDELFLHFSSKVQNLTVFFFYYSHDSNSIFRARRINSEWVFRCTVYVKTLNGKTISVKYDPQATVDQIRKQIEGKT